MDISKCYKSEPFSKEPVYRTSLHLTLVIRIPRACLVPQMVRNPPAMQDTRVQSLGWEDSSGEGNGNLLQCCCLENSMDRGAWKGTVHGVAKSQTQLSD